MFTEGCTSKRTGSSCSKDRNSLMVFREGFLKAPVIMVLVCLPSDALATPTVLLGFLLPGMWGIFSWLLQQSAAAPPYLGRGVSFHGHPS